MPAINAWSEHLGVPQKFMISCQVLSMQHHMHPFEREYNLKAARAY